MFKVGDWVINGYDIVQIMKIDNDGVKSVSDGSFRKSGWNLQCFPLTLANKRAAETADYYMRNLHKDRGNQMLNFPQLARTFEDFAAEIYNTAEELRSPSYARMEKF